MHQIVQVAGALLILAAFVLAQFRVLDNRAYGYLWPNFFGSTVLTVDAWREEQWGFFILEFVWALVSGWGIVERLRGREPAAAH